MGRHRSVSYSNSAYKASLRHTESVEIEIWAGSVRYNSHSVILSVLRAKLVLTKISTSTTEA